MLLLAHIFIAIGSVLYASYLIFRPSKQGLNISYGLVGTTLATGFALIVVAHVPILSTCVSGLVYTTLVSASLAIARRRLQAQEADQN